MARNSLAGKRTGKSKTAKFYAKNPKSKAKKKSYDKKYHSTTERKNYRVSLNKANRNNPRSKKGDGKDMSHTQTGSLVLELQRRNRARNRGKKA
tara:strand:- start:677 stop:958 length:282 start_codon:yes stop_codon:yes gene_type:complete